jgi:hypothetical protein
MISLGVSCHFELKLIRTGDKADLTGVAWKRLKTGKAA